MVMRAREGFLIILSDYYTKTGNQRVLENTRPLWRQSLEEVFRETLPKCHRRTVQPLVKCGMFPPGRAYGKWESVRAHVGLPQVNVLNWMKAVLG